MRLRSLKKGRLLPSPVQIVFLGTSGSWPTPKRSVAAVAVKRGPEVILFDCGEGTQRQFMLSKLSFMQVSKVFITHFHGDHFLGLPGMIQSMSMNDREKPLHVYGPEGMSKLLVTLVTLGYFAPGFRIDVTEMKGGSSIDFGEYMVTAIDAKHAVPAISYCIEERQRPGRFDKEKALALGIPTGPLFGKLQDGHTVTVNGRTFTPDLVMGPPRRGRKIVYTGDTEVTPRLVEFAKGCDVLIHDATADSSMEAKANKYGHSTAKQAATVAKECNAKALILTHISPRFEDATPILVEAKAVFENSILADDFLEYNVPYSD